MIQNGSFLRRSVASRKHTIISRWKNLVLDGGLAQNIVNAILTIQPKGEYNRIEQVVITDNEIKTCCYDSLEENKLGMQYIQKKM